MEEQLAALIQSVNEGRVANDAKLEAIQHSLELWRPAVTNLQQQFDDLRTQVGHIALHPALADEAAAAVELVVRAHPASSSSDHGHHGPRGHGAIDISGGLVHGVVTTLAASGQGRRYWKRCHTVIIGVRSRSQRAYSHDRCWLQRHPFSEECRQCLIPRLKTGAV